MERAHAPKASRTPNALERDRLRPSGKEALTHAVNVLHPRNATRIVHRARIADRARAPRANHTPSALARDHIHPIEKEALTHAVNVPHPRSAARIAHQAVNADRAHVPRAVRTPSASDAGRLLRIAKEVPTRVVNAPHPETGPSDLRAAHAPMVVRTQSVSAKGHQPQGAARAHNAMTDPALKATARAKVILHAVGIAASAPIDRCVAMKNVDHDARSVAGPIAAASGVARPKMGSATVASV